MRLRLTIVLIGAATSTWAQTPSPFETYRRFSDEPVVDWRKANDQVGQIGGWRAYAREAAGARAAAPSPAASAASAPGTAPAHGGHRP